VDLVVYELSFLYWKGANSYMEMLDIQQRQKQFFKTVYEPLLKKSNHIEALSSDLKDNQYIRLLQTKDNYTNTKSFNNIDDVVFYTTANHSQHMNNYFTLSATNGQGGTQQDLLNRSVLGFDFDKKEEKPDFNHKDVVFRFKKIGLFYHSLIDSGNGYHVYIMIQPTNDIKKIKAVQEELGRRLEADENALKPTQLLRVPYTYNVKNKDYKRVNIIHLEDKNTIKRKSIDELFERYCNYEKPISSKTTNYIKATTNIPPCIDEILKKGSPEGQRNNDLIKIVVTLRKRNKTLNEIQEIISEWAYKSDYNDNIKYRIKWTYNNTNNVKMDCKGCQHYDSCFNAVQSDFIYSDEHKVLKVTETRIKTIGNRSKGVKSMNGNDLIIYGVLLNNQDGLHRKEIIKEITYKGNARLSDKTLTSALQQLEANGFIEVKGKPKFYKIKPIRSKVDLTFNISYGATYEAIKGHITPDELKLYNYMRYLHNKQQREDNKALKGNLFQINQVELAKELGLSRGRVTQMIQQLLQEKLLGIWYRQPSKNNGYDYNIYRLNY